jgi:hypothetical protein
LSQLWNKLELDLLRRSYPTHGKNEPLKLFPNRTYQAIQRIASYYGVKRVLVDYELTPEIRAKMSKAHLGIKLSETHRAALRKRTLNEMAFDLRTEHSDYWIGFLMADGNVSYKKGFPIIALHVRESDMDHLLKFRKFVGSSHAVGHYLNKTRGNSSCSISFSSERLANVLEKYGVVQRKCFTAQAKGGLEYSKHFWRGLIDGDGSLGYYERKCLNASARRVPYINITGSKHICSIQNFSRERDRKTHAPKVVLLQELLWLCDL